MAYTKVTMEVVIDADEEECLLHALHDAMEKFEHQTTVYSTEITSRETAEPLNAAEIAAPCD